MSHFFNTADLEVKLFELMQFVSASKEFCSAYRIDRGSNKHLEMIWEQYAGHLKSGVCGRLIEISVNLRMLQDYALSERGAKKEELDRLDEAVSSYVKLGSKKNGSFKLSLRESFNKIIHATSVSLVWRKNGYDNVAMAHEYWSGLICLKGKKGSELWELDIDVLNWSMATLHYLDDLKRDLDLFDNLDSEPEPIFSP